MEPTADSIPDPIPHTELSTELLSAEHDLTCFYIGDEPGDKDLEDFIKTHALQEQEDLIGKTRVCLWNGEIVGFITLAASSIRKDNLHRRYQTVRGYPVYPCILIGRLAVAKNKRDRDIGSFLLDLAIGIAFDGPVGCMLLRVDPKENSVNFYTKAGFVPMEKEKTRNPPGLFLDIAKVKKVWCDSRLNSDHTK